MKARRNPAFIKAEHKITNMIKALFFDIDGTLVSFKTHDIPPSAVKAIEKAKSQGIKVFISTGRPMPFIINLGQINHLIDGYITANGACCYINNEIINMTPIPGDEARTIIDFCIKNSYPVIVVGTRHISVVNYNDLVKRLFTDLLKVEYERFSTPLETTLCEDILQISPFMPYEVEKDIMPLASGCISERWTPEFSDITSRDADKAKGLEAIAATQDLLISECMAFGDGGNDRTILRKAGTGIAMGNANDEVKAFADYVTSDIDDNGIADALKHYGII